MDIYKKYIKPDASHEHLFKIGKVLTLAFIIMAVFIAPLTSRFPGVFSCFIMLLSITQGPVFAILLLGMIWKRANGTGAVAGLIFGVVTSSTLFWIKDGIFRIEDPALYVAWWSFSTALITTIVISLLTPPPAAESVRRISIYN